MNKTYKEVTSHYGDVETQKRVGHDLHSLQGPALVQHFGSGAIYRKLWSRAGKIHREDGAALVWYDTRGEIISEGWYSYGVWDPDK